MRYGDLIKPEEVEVELPDGTVKVYVLSGIPATEGRELAFIYPQSGLPKIGDYATNEKMMMKLMARVAVVTEGGSEPICLTSKALIDNHVPSWETLVKLEGLMIARNCSFFTNGKGSTFLEGIVAKSKTWAMQTLTTFSQSSSKSD